MTRIRIAIAACALSVLVAVSGCGDTGSEANDTTAVLLVTVDGIVSDELALLGGARSMPNLEAIAGAGRAWGNGWTVCPMTRPAVASILTGLAPDRHGVRDDLFTPLPVGVPTLASQLRDRGWQTAAFPGSGWLGRDSGLLDGFDVVDDPPTAPIGPARWFPPSRPASELASDFDAWLGGVPGDESWFAWIHVSTPLLEQLREVGRAAAGSSGEDGDEEPVEPSDPLTDLDRALGTIMAAVERHGDLDRAAVVVVGTLGDATGGEENPPGPGLTLDDPAVRVPIVARFPEGTTVARAGDRPVWTPDIPATIAALTGISLSGESEGVDLFEDVAADRPVISWSWATLDAMDWRPLSAARAGSDALLLGEPAGTETANGTLEEILAARAEPSRAAVSMDAIRPILEGDRGLELKPADPAGRDFDSAAKRREFASILWGGRFLVLDEWKGGDALRRLRDAMEVDPGNPAVLLDRGQTLMLIGSSRAQVPLRIAVSRHPTDPELLHWYAHAIWTDSLDDAEKILDAIAPFKRQDGDVLYDLACLRSLAGDFDAAEDFLRRAIESGYREFGFMETDPDLRALRESGRFYDVLKDYGQ